MAGKNGRDLIAVTSMGFIFGALLSWALVYRWGSAPAVKPVDMAAWTQAVGSVIAIAVAVWVPYASERRRLGHEQQLENAKARSLAVNMIPETWDVHSRLETLRFHVQTWIDNEDVSGYAKWKPNYYAKERPSGTLPRARLKQDAAQIADLRSSCAVTDDYRAAVPQLVGLKDIGEQLLNLMVSLDRLDRLDRLIEHVASNAEKNLFKNSPLPNLLGRLNHCASLASSTATGLDALFPVESKQAWPGRSPPP